MGNSIICSECKCKMHLIKNWGNIYTGDSHGAYFETFTLFAYRMKNAFMKGVGFKKVKPKMYVCQQCGNQMSFDSIHLIKGDEDFLDKTPYDIGIPLLHIISGRVGMKTNYYEFTGDELEIFKEL